MKKPRQDRLSLRTQELRPGRTGPSQRRVDAVGFKDLPNGRRRDLYSQPGQFPVDSPVSPFGVLPRQPENQGLDVPAGRRPAGLAAQGSRRPAAADDVAVPAQDRTGGDRQPQPLAPRSRYHADQGCEQCPVRPVRSRAARLSPLQDGELVAQDQDLGDLLRLLTPGRPQPRGQSHNQEEHEPQAHDR